MFYRFTAGGPDVFRHPPSLTQDTAYLVGRRSHSRCRPGRGRARFGEYVGRGHIQIGADFRRQAMAMAELAASRAHSQKVKGLASKIKADQRPEINRISAWLRAWGQQIPAPAASGMPGRRQPVPGMMSSDEMAKLMAASGPAFEKLFLAMMICHHQGAVHMAKAERLHGQYEPARAMAQSIIASQTAQIAQMRAMLDHSAHHGCLTH